jgi:UDP-glucuronate 4-epimerase
MTSQILVTGAAGFIGGHACRMLLDQHWSVVGLDNFDPFYDRSVKEATLAPLSAHPRFTFIEGDIRDQDAVQHALAGTDAVLHLAAKAGVLPSLRDPLGYTAVNIDGTVQLLDGCRAAGIRRFVFGSSSSVYGDSTPVPFDEVAPAVEPLSPYAATKRAGEFLCAVYAQLHGLRIAALRFFTVYGPRQRPDLAIHRFTRLLTGGSPILQFGDGSSSRDYTHVRDILQGIDGAIRWTEQPAATCEVFNLGGSNPIRLDALIAMLGRALGVEPRIEVQPVQPGETTRTYANIAKARRVLGYDPTVPLDDGIKEFVAWYTETHG